MATTFRVLAFMQNQWVRDPEQLRRILARHDEDFRRRMIHKLLFAGCLTGRRIRAAFGDDLCRSIVWEEASREITGASNGCPDADVEHMQAAFDQVKPDIVLTFGRLAERGFMGVRGEYVWIKAPHPASRDQFVTRQLAGAAMTLRETLAAPHSEGAGA